MVPKRQKKAKAKAPQVIFGFSPLLDFQTRKKNKKKIKKKIFFFVTTEVHFLFSVKKPLKIWRS